MTINELKILLYKSIDENGLNHKTTVKLSQRLDKLISKDTKENNIIIEDLREIKEIEIVEVSKHYE